MRSITKLSAAILALAVALTLLPLPTLAAGRAAAAEDTESDELLYQYMLQLARKNRAPGGGSASGRAGGFAVRASSIQAAKATVGSSLTGVEKALYDALVARVCLVADGTLKDTEFAIPYSELGANLSMTKAEAAQAGYTLVTGSSFSAYVIDTFASRLRVNTIMHDVLFAVMMDHPYEMYWFDKTVGVSTTPVYGIDPVIQNGEVVEARIVAVNGAAEPHVLVKFCVLSAYSASGQSSTTKVGTYNPAAAVAAAQALVAAVDGKPDYEKLCAYKEYICAQVSYDQSATTGGYKAAHQMLNVFDGNPNTNVVCEGYSKALKYLCDLSDIACYTVSGRMGTPKSSENHMWNIVTLEGKNYLVDVTNCDGDNNSRAVGYPDKLFLKGADTASAAGCTACTCSYTYDDDTKNALDDAGRTVSVHDYPVFYRLDGWFKDAAKTVSFNFAVDTISSKTTIHAKWTPISYAIGYDLDGGTETTANPTSFTIETPPFTLSNPVKANARFDGWTGGGSTAAQQTLRIDPAETLAAAAAAGGTGELSFTAHWTAQYAVSVAGGVVNGTVAVNPDRAVAGEEVTVTAQPDAGYELGTIRTAPNRTVKDGKFTMPDSNVSVSATFRPAALTGTVAVTGKAQVGETLRASVSDTNNTGTLSYQWNADGASIGGATGSTYTLSGLEKGKTITCTVSSSIQTGGITSVATSAVEGGASKPTTYSVFVAGNIANGTVKVSKTAAGAGDAVTVTATPDEGYALDAIHTNPNLSITGGTFVMPASDVTVTAVFKAVESAGQLTGAVTVTGHPVVGQTLTATLVGANSSAAVSYQWMANGVVIPGATESSYTLTAADAGKTITCCVTSDGRIGAITSEGTSKVSENTTAAQPTPLGSSGSAPLQGGTQTGTQTGTSGNLTSDKLNGTVTILGEAVVGQTLAANVSGVNGGDLRYRWTADGRTIAGAWGATYTITGEDVRCSISVIVTSRALKGELRSESTAPVERAAVEQQAAAALNRTNPLTAAQPQSSVPVQQPWSARQIFYDVTGSEWFASAVDWAYHRGLMVGTSEHMFSPGFTMNRAMMAQILYNFAGSDSGDVTAAFSDVSAANWYGRSVTWAVSNGIARSYGDYFGATDDLTREDMVAMLYNYAAMSGFDVYEGADLSGYADSAGISDWARGAMAWAVRNGIVNGTGDNSLSPQGTATRAQLAAIMKRFCEIYMQ